MYQGLVDSPDSSPFDITLNAIKKWRNHDPLKSDRFYDWIVRYESDVMKETMLKSVRQQVWETLQSSSRQMLVNQ